MCVCVQIQNHFNNWLLSDTSWPVQQHYNKETTNWARPCFTENNVCSRVNLVFVCVVKTRWRTLSKPTRMPSTSARRTCSQHTPSGWAWPSTSPSSTMKSSTRPSRPAPWPSRWVDVTHVKCLWWLLSHTCPSDHLVSEVFSISFHWELPGLT